MSHQIIEQPDGKLCVFSSIVDGFVIVDATGQDLLDYYAAEAAISERQRVAKIIAHVRSGEPEKSYHRNVLSYEQAVTLDRRREAGELDG
jgi:hypothetical protein